MLRLDEQVGWEELVSRNNFAREGLAPLRFNISDKTDLKRAKALGLGSKVELALEMKSKISSLEGVFDLPQECYMLPDV